MNTEQATNHRCPCCGRYVGIDPDGYYDTAERNVDPDTCHVAAFCDETCANQFHGRAALTAAERSAS